MTGPGNCGLPDGTVHAHMERCYQGGRADERAALAGSDREAGTTHKAEDAEQRGEGICRTCLAPIWNEGGEVGHIKRAEGWSDRIERGGDSLVCFRAVHYRHEPLTGREAAIYDRAYTRGIEEAGKPATDFAGRHPFIEDIDDLSMCICGVPAVSHDVVYPPIEQDPRRGLGVSADGGGY